MTERGYSEVRRSDAIAEGRDTPRVICRDQLKTGLLRTRSNNTASSSRTYLDTYGQQVFVNFVNAALRYVARVGVGA